MEFTFFKKKGEGSQHKKGKERREAQVRKAPEHKGLSWMTPREETGTVNEHL